MSETQPQFIWRCFTDLSHSDLYDLLRLRQDVFLVEQQCLFPDMDGRDHAAIHLLVKGKDGLLLGCCRVLPPESEVDCVAIGRFVVRENVRGQGLGHEMMREAVKECASRFSGNAMLVRAQSHLAGFYGHHGFRVSGKEYMEDGIPHIDLVRAVKSPGQKTE